MSDLTFKIHTKDGNVSTYVFEKAVHEALYLVSQYDAGVSQRATGSLNWFVSDLRNNGSMAFDFISRPKRSRNKSQLPPNLVPQITHSLLTGVDELETRGIAPVRLSEKGLERVGKLADLLQKDGALKFSFATNEESADITEKTSENVRTLLPLKRTAFGSAEGRLDGINIHRSYRALLYHSVTKRVITCMFEPFQLDDVKSALGKLVIVRGELKKNVNGDTVRIVKPKLEVIEGTKRFSLPTLPKSLKGGLRPLSFESERTTADYMRRIRGG